MASLGGVGLAYCSCAMVLARRGTDALSVEGVVYFDKIFDNVSPSTRAESFPLALSDFAANNCSALQFE